MEVAMAAKEPPMAAKEPPPLKDPENELQWRWLKDPATYCDAYNVDVWPGPGVVRISFGEFTNKEYLPFFRAAIVMPISDAKSLAETLIALIREAEQDKEKREKSSELSE